MSASNEFCGTPLIQALSEDIERELRIADEHIARALVPPRLEVENALFR